MQHKRNILIALMVILTGWLLLCTHIAGYIPIREILARLSIPVLVYVAAALLLSLFGRKAKVVLFVMLCAFTLFECGEGILQMMGKVRPNNPYFILTGNFVNQGLYGGLMALSATACLFEFIHNKKKGIRIAIGSVFIAAFVMMCISVSRAAWVGFITAAIVILYRETEFRINFKKSINKAVAVIIAAAVCAVVISVKPESALARVHIWRMDCRAIMENPLLGRGAATEMSAYADAQEHFFSARQRTTLAERTADNPVFAFNEFLKFGMQGGVPALVLSLAVFILSAVLLLKKRSEYAYLLLTFGVFSLFSFPMYSIALNCILAVLLADASVTGEEKCKWGLAAVAILTSVAVYPLACHYVKYLQTRYEWVHEESGHQHLGKFFPELRYDNEFIGTYANALYSRGYYKEAMSILTDGLPFTCSSLYYCLLGICREYTGDIMGAEKDYKRAMKIVPKRMMPYYLLMRHYNSLGFTSIAEAYRQKALSMPYDTTQTETVRIRTLIENMESEQPFDGGENAE